MGSIFLPFDFLWNLSMSESVLKYLEELTIFNWRENGSFLNSVTQNLNIDILQALIRTRFRAYSGGYSMLMFKSFLLCNFWMNPNIMDRVGTCQTPVMVLFREIVKRLNFWKKSSTIDVWQGPKYTSDDEKILFAIKVNLFQPSVAFHIETSHLFYRAKQMTWSYMKRNTGMKWIYVKWTIRFSFA